MLRAGRGSSVLLGGQAGLWVVGAGRAVRLRKGKAGGKDNRQDNGECRTWPQRS